MSTVSIGCPSYQSHISASVSSASLRSGIPRTSRLAAASTGRAVVGVVGVDGHHVERDAVAVARVGRPVGVEAVVAADAR